MATRHKPRKGRHLHSGPSPASGMSAPAPTPTIPTIETLQQVTAFMANATSFTAVSPAMRLFQFQAAVALLGGNPTFTNAALDSIALFVRTRSRYDDGSLHGNLTAFVAEERAKLAATATATTPSST